MATDSKTSKLIRMDLPVGRLVKNDKNPNKMSSREFDLLCDNIGKTGLTDAILVRPISQAEMDAEIKGAKGQAGIVEALMASAGKFRIVGGHHRYDAACFLGFEDVPVTIINDPTFDDDAETFQLVRMNMIRGKLDPQAFLDMYNNLAESYSDEVMQDAFGFADEAEFRKLIDQSAKAFTDPTMKKKFKEAAEEIKTIDGLSKLLNEMFTKYGDTLPYGFMVFDHGGQRSMWLRVEKKTMNALDLIGEMCIEQQRTVDDILGYVLQAATKGELSDILQAAIEKSSPVAVPAGFIVAPTKENLEKA